MSIKTELSANEFVQLRNQMSKKVPVLRHLKLSWVLSSSFIVAYAVVLVKCLTNDTTHVLRDAGITQIATIVLVLLLWKAGIKHHLMKAIHKNRFSDPLVVSIELRNDCIWTQSHGTQVGYDWGLVTSICKTPKYYEVLAGRDGGIFIPRKSLSSETEQMTFERILRQCTSHVQILERRS